MASARHAAGRIAATVLVLAVLVLAAYLALNAIPAAQRPSLITPASHRSGATSPHAVPR